MFTILTGGLEEEVLIEKGTVCSGRKKRQAYRSKKEWMGGKRTQKVPKIKPC